MPSTFQKIRDWSIKGFQLQKTYFDDWDAMKDIFHRLGLDINIHGPLITMNEARNVRLSHLLACEISKDSPLHKKDIFITVLRTLPRYGRIKTEREFTSFIKKHLIELHTLTLSGTMKQTDELFEKKVRELIGE